MPKSNLPCDKCGSSDALTEYEDGHSYCYSCKSWTKTGEEDMPLRPPVVPSKQRLFTPSSHSHKAANVPQRGLQELSVAYYGVGVEFSETTGEVEKLHYPVYQKGELTGYKIKNLADKSFTAIGNVKSPDLFGQKQAGSGGKLLIVTEGEEDCMSAHQLLAQAGKQYKVVSLPNGANLTAIRKNLEWVESFDTVILNLDNDDTGIKCAKEIGALLTPGKVKIAELPTKDANDFLQAGKGGVKYLKCIYNAKPYRPDGVVNLADSWELMWADESQNSILYPWAGLNDKLYGMRDREIVTWTAGTGTGKSAVVRELEYWLLRNTEDNIGILALEESIGRTSWGLVAVEANLPLAIRELRKEMGITQDKPEVKGWFDATVGTGRIHSFDHWGSTAEEDLINKVRYMIKGLECKWIILDHLSIVVSAMDSMQDERRAIDAIMTKLRKLCEETGAGMHLVCHLRRIDGNRGHEQGVEVGLSHLRGSQAIAQLSDAVVAMERNQQADDEREANLTRLRVLKNRYAGLTGLATNLAYNRGTGRLQEITNVEEYLAPTVEEAGV